MLMLTGRRIIVYGAKKLMANDIFSGNDEKYCSVVVITMMFTCFDVEVYILTYKTTTTMTFKLKKDQTV